MTMTKAPTDPKYGHVLRAIYERPWAIQPSTLALIVELIRFRAAGGRLSDDEIEARVQAATSKNGPRKGARTSGAIAVIPVYGVISQRQNLMSANSGGTSIEGLTADFREALADPGVDGIVLEIDSPGGGVEGVDELAAEIRAARGQKPIVAQANGLAASAAYWLGSQADEFVVTPSGMVGSIGVYTAHEDLSKAAEMEGVKVTLIKAGKHKAEATPWEPLSDEARAHLQEQVDDVYGTFVSAVAKGRRTPIETVRSGYGEGRALLAKKAMAAGMVDRIDTLDNTIHRVARMALAQADDAGAAAIHGEGARLVSIDWAGGELEAKAIASHKTATDEEPWDGPAEEAKIPNDAGSSKLRGMYAWEDPDKDPETKAAYKFIHHRWTDGPGAASTVACSTGIAVLNGGRTGTTIPDADKQGVYNHLAAHLRDAGKEPPPFTGSAVLDSGPPFAARLELVSALAQQLVEHATERADMRAKQGRGLSAADRAGLRKVADSLLALGMEPDPDPEPDPEPEPEVWALQARNRARLAIARAELNLE